MKKLIAIFLVLLFVTPMIFADGMAHYYDDTWKPLAEKQQVAAINYENGYENMILTIDIDQTAKGEKAVWMFPVPASPDDTVIDVVNGFPQFGGQNINTLYKRNLGTYYVLSSIYSSIPGLGLLLPFALMGTLSGGFSYNAQTKTNEVWDGVEIHEVVDKYGITTELITTKTSEGLYGYLNSKGLDLPIESTKMLDEYVGGDYSFVVSYIGNLDEFNDFYFNKENDHYYEKRGSPLGVFVKFPTEKIYFPLKPTSVYGSTSIPLTLYITGHVTPNLYSEIGLAKTEYFSGSSYGYYGNSYNESNLDPFYNGEIRNRQGHTKITMNVPSKYFKEDLWIENSAPIGVGMKNGFNAGAGIIGIIIYAIVSMLASLAAGLVAFRGRPITKLKLALMGLFNFATILGIIIAGLSWKTKKVPDKLMKDIKEAKIGIVLFDKMKLLYFGLFFVFFLIINFIIVSFLLLF